VQVEELEKPAVVVITEEFGVIASRVAVMKGRPSLRRLVLPYPLESREEAECRAIARAFYPKLLAVLGVVA
jgi:hypothetical protein